MDIKIPLPKMPRWLDRLLDWANAPCGLSVCGYPIIPLDVLEAATVCGLIAYYCKSLQWAVAVLYTLLSWAMVRLTVKYIVR